MPDSEWVRVRDNATGHHFTIHRSTLEVTSGLTELKQDAVDVNGAPLPDKPRVEVSTGTKADKAAASE